MKINYFLLCSLLWLCGGSYICAQVSPPQIHCIVVDSTGAATVTWTIPSDTNNTFLSYDIWSSVNKVSGFTNTGMAYSENINSVYITGIDANVSPVYFYGFTNSTKGISNSGDTLQSIFLSVTNLGGVAFLKWNAMCTPNLPSFNGWYKIYREYPQYIWSLLDSTKALSYYDTITICKAALNYKIITDDASGCQSVSNRAGGVFSDIFVPVSPILDTVSVAGNNIEISWYPSNSGNVVGYFIYEYQSGNWVCIDTTTGIHSTYYNYTSGSPGTGSRSFCVTAFDSCDNISSLSKDQQTIYLVQTPDAVAQKNVLSWNKYINLIPGVGKYDIYENINGGPYKLLATTDTLQYVQTGLNTTETLCYYIRVKGASDSDITASSNIVCYTVTGVNELSANLGLINIYPNPSNGIFTISMQNATDKAQIEIYNMLGQSIYRNTLNSTNTYINIGIQPVGIYLYRIITAKDLLIGEGKIMIE